MSNVVALLSASKALEIIRRLSEKSHNVRFTEHAQERMEERDITLFDIQNILKKGDIKGNPTKCPKTKNGWICKIVRHARGNRDIGVITVIVNMEHLRIVTVEWEDLR